MTIDEQADAASAMPEPPDAPATKRQRSNGANGKHNDKGAVRLPPNSLECEQAVLGCILREPASCMAECTATLKIARDEFYDLRHQTIYACLLWMLEQSIQIDIVSLVQTLKESDDLNAVGGIAYIATLPDSVPSAALLSTYAATLRDKFARRQTLQIATRATGMAYDETIDASRLPNDLADQVSAAVKSARAPFPEIVDLAYAVSNPEPMPDEVIQGILHRGTIMVVGGSAKAHKSWILADMALSVAHGREWMGLKCNQGNVLYLNMEIISPGKTRRFSSVANARGIDIQSGCLDVWNFKGHVADYKHMLPKIQARAAERGYTLIILDPIYRIYGDTDENSAQDVNNLLTSIEQFAVACNAAVVFAAHFSKGNQAAKEPMDRISGSGVFARFPDTIMVFTLHEADEAFTVHTTLRNHPPAPEFVVRWKFPLFYMESGLDPKDIKQPQKVSGPKPKYTPESVLEWLNPAGMSPGQWMKKTVEQIGISRASFHRIRAELLASGSVTLKDELYRPATKTTPTEESSAPVVGPDISNPDPTILLPTPLIQPDLPPLPDPTSLQQTLPP